MNFLVLMNARRIYEVCICPSSIQDSLMKGRRDKRKEGIRMKKILITILALILTLSVFVGCDAHPKDGGEKTDDVSDTDNGERTPGNVTPEPDDDVSKSYVNNKYFYKTRYPKNWEITSDDEDIVTFTSDASAIFKPNANLKIEKGTARDKTAEEYVENAIEVLAEFISEFELIETGDRENEANWKGKYMKYSGKMAGFNLIFYQVVFVKDNNAYLFTFAADEENFDTYLEESIMMVDKWEFF